MYSCSFFGHREMECTDELKNQLTKIIEDLIEKENYTIFYFGGFGQFDDLCHNIVTELKQKYIHVKRIFCLLSHEHIRKRPKGLNGNDYEEFAYFVPQYDGWYKRIYYRNLEIINNSDYIVFFVKRANESGAYKALQYAVKKKKKFINVAI